MKLSFRNLFIKKNEKFNIFHISFHLISLKLRKIYLIRILSWESFLFTLKLYIKTFPSLTEMKRELNLPCHAAFSLSVSLGIVILIRNFLLAFVLSPLCSGSGVLKRITAP